MATTKSSNFVWEHSEDDLNSSLSKSAQKELDEVSAGDEPGGRRVSWTDFYTIFRNSRRLVRESNQLAAVSSDDGDLKAMSEVMQESHTHLRGALFLVVIENYLLNLSGNINASSVLWEYGNVLEIADMISRHLDREQRPRLAA